jgi:hypothetical protein
MCARTLFRQAVFPSPSFAAARRTADPGLVRWFPALMAFLVFVMLFAAAGCGSGGKQAAGPQDPRDPGFAQWRGFHRSRLFALDFAPAPGLISGDWNEDGWTDLAAFDSAGRRVVLLAGRVPEPAATTETAVSNIAFETPRPLPANGDPVQGAAADFNRDGYDDIAFVQHQGRVLTVWSGDGRDGFTARDYSLPAKGRLLRAADLNGDRFPDLVTLSSERTTDGVALTVYLGSAGGFTEAWNAWNEAQVPRDLVLAEVTGDRERDILLTSWEEEKPLWVYPGNGDGQFAAAVHPGGLAEPGRHDGTNRAYAGDLNGDGTTDLATTHTINTHELVAIRAGRGNGAFHAAQRFPTELPEAVTAADVNLDEKMDLIVTHRSSSAVSYLLNQGNGTFNAPTLLRIGREMAPAPLIVGDFNRDQWPDVAVVNLMHRSITVLENGGPRP